MYKIYNTLREAQQEGQREHWGVEGNEPESLAERFLSVEAGCSVTKDYARRYNRGCVSWSNYAWMNEIVTARWNSVCVDGTSRYFGELVLNWRDNDGQYADQSVGR